MQVFALVAAGLVGLAAAGSSAFRVEEAPAPVFQQRLLICNAYPSASHATVRLNGKTDMTDASQGLSFQDCKYFSHQLHSHDRLDFSLAGLGVEGTFEVGDLPASDSVLLLVVEKRAGAGPLVSFQSFAFPTNTANNDAQLAVIDASGGSPRALRLKMEDHINGKEEKTVSKRVEELNFNRVYAIEAGDYDSAVVDSSGEPAAAEAVSKRELAMRRKQNYVVLWTGDDDKFKKTLVAFPPEVRSGAANRGLCAALAAGAVALGLVGGL